MRAPPTSLAGSSTSCAPARVPRPRANGRRPACSVGNASRRATTASIRASCWPWRASRSRKTRTSCRSVGAEALRDFARLSRDVTVLSRLQLDRRGAGAPRPEIGVGLKAHRGPGLRLLHRLQRAQDAAHRATCARYHGCAWHHLPGDGRAEPLLRRHRSFAPATSRCRGAWARTRWRRCRTRSPAR